MGEISLVLKNASFSYNEKLMYSAVDFSLKKGRLTALIGLNGSGKTTLFDILTGQKQLQKGHLSVFGKSIREWPQKELASKIGLVLTSFDMDDELMVHEVLESGRMPFTGFLGRLQLKDYEVMNRVIEEMNLTPILKNKFANCSDGEKQRVLIGAAFVKEADILLLDEPTAFMDLNNKVSLYTLLQEQKEEKIILFSTHDVQMAIEVADDFLVIHDKRIQLYDRNTFVNSGVLNELFDNKQAFFNEEGKLLFK